MISKCEQWGHTYDLDGCCEYCNAHYWPHAFATEEEVQDTVDSLRVIEKDLEAR